jgi:hypothetical protein
MRRIMEAAAEKLLFCIKFSKMLHNCSLLPFPQGAGAGFSLTLHRKSGPGMLIAN